MYVSICIFLSRYGRKATAVGSTLGSTSTMSLLSTLLLPDWYGPLRDSFAIQIAHAAGATVIATSSSDEKLKISRALGAAHTINYKKLPEWEKEVIKLVSFHARSKLKIRIRSHTARLVDKRRRGGPRCRNRWPSNLDEIPRRIKVRWISPRRRCASRGARFLRLLSLDFELMSQSRTLPQLADVRMMVMPIIQKALNLHGVQVGSRTQ